MRLKPYLIYRDNRIAYKDIVQKALGSGQKVDDITQVLKVSGNEFSKKTLSMVKYWSEK